MNTLEAFDTAIGLERKLSRMYQKFSSLFKANVEAHNFWTSIADQEKIHSETLTLSKSYLMGKRPGLQQKDVPLIEKSDTDNLESLPAMIKDCERRIKKEKLSLQEALDMLIEIENSELNHMYHRLIDISGLKLPRKANDDYRTMDEHIRVIESFIVQHYKGKAPVISKPAEPQRTVSAPGRKTGKIVEVIKEMSYGFIEGADGQKYMFLSGDIPQGNLPGGNRPGKNRSGKNRSGKNRPGKNTPGKNTEDAEVNSPVEFSVVGLPWGLRATNITFRD